MNARITKQARNVGISLFRIGNAANRVAKKNGTACGGRGDGAVPSGGDFKS